MGYLDNTEITVDAILTKKGRQKLAQGQSLSITKFSLGDDEIDYSLYEPAHPKGSAFYDSAIKAIPITEATAEESQALRFKLVTLPKGTTQIPIVKFGAITSLITNQDEGGTDLSPTTSPSGNQNAGFTLVLADQRAGTLTVTQAADSNGTTSFLSDEVSTTAQVVKGLRFRFTPNPSLRNDISTTLTVIGNETGGSQTIPVIVNFKD